VDWGGLIVGFVLGVMGTAALDLWREHRQADAVRTMLGLEIERNVQTLEDLTKTLRKRGAPVLVAESLQDKNFREHAAAQTRAEVLIARSLPAWSQEVWTSQMPFIPRALKPQQINEGAAFYGALDEFAALRTSLSEAAAIDQAIALAREPPPAEIAAITEFDKRVSMSREKIMDLDADALAKGRACLSFLR